MAGTEPLLLDHAKQLRASLGRDVRESKVGQTERRAGVPGIRRDRTDDAGVAAQLQIRLDAVKGRIERLERRAESSD